MLTDYHVHLRPDDLGSTAEEYFTAANAERYEDVAAERGIGALGVSEHVYRFVQSLEVWQHPFWRENARDEIDSYWEFGRSETDRALGNEADYVAGTEDRLANLLDAREWDYVLGSVHFIRDGAVHMEGTRDAWSPSDPQQVWRRYFEHLGDAARSGLFDVLTHPDLVKVWGA